MILEVCWDGLWTLSFGLPQFHGSWLMCEEALNVQQFPIEAWLHDPAGHGVESENQPIDNLRPIWQIFEEFFKWHSSTSAPSDHLPLRPPNGNELVRELGIKITIFYVNWCGKFLVSLVNLQSLQVQAIFWVPRRLSSVTGNLSYITWNYFESTIVVDWYIFFTNTGWLFMTHIFVVNAVVVATTTLVIRSSVTYF